MSRLTTFLEYLKTVAITLFVAFILVLVLMGGIQYTVYNTIPNRIAKEKKEDAVIDYYLIGVLIDKNKYLESQNPKNYKINLKLGMLYEIKMDSANAEVQYKISIAKAPYNDFVPIHKLACLYIKQNRLDAAQALIDGVDETPDKRTNKLKEDLYKKLGDKYYNIADYETASEKYEKAMTYAKVVKDKKEIKYLKESLASSYVYLAEKFIDNLQPEYAIEYLQLANSIVNAPIIKYKLALLLMADNPKQAYSYLDEVFTREPSIINYDKYFNFLSQMALEANENGNSAQAELYRYKIKKLKEYSQTNILSVDDLRIEYASGRMKLNFWKNKI